MATPLYDPGWTCPRICPRETPAPPFAINCTRYRNRRLAYVGHGVFRSCLCPLIANGANDANGVFP